MRIDNIARFTNEALKKMTPQQHRSIVTLLDGEHSIDVALGGFSLPDNYVAFELTFKDGGVLVGGIDEFGSVST